MSLLSFSVSFSLSLFLSICYSQFLWQSLSLQLRHSYFLMFINTIGQQRTHLQIRTRSVSGQPCAFSFLFFFSFHLIFFSVTFAFFFLSLPLFLCKYDNLKYFLEIPLVIQKLQNRFLQFFYHKYWTKWPLP